MSASSIENRVRTIIVDQLGCEEETVTPEKSFRADLGADELDLTELIMAVEEEFDIVIPDNDAEMVRTVGDLITYIGEHMV